MMAKILKFSIQSGNIFCAKSCSPTPKGEKVIKKKRKLGVSFRDAVYCFTDFSDSGMDK